MWKSFLPLIHESFYECINDGKNMPFHTHLAALKNNLIK